MKATRKKKTPTVSGPTQRQRSLLESLGIVNGAAAPAARPPKSPPLVVGKQRSLDGLAKVVRKNKGESSADVLSRCLGTLGDYQTRCYQRAVGGGGRAAGDGGEGASTSAAAPAAAPAASTATATEDQARAALRELSCVRVDASLMISSGAGAALRRFRKDPHASAALSVQAEKILTKWREAVASEVRAGRRYRAHAASAASSAAAAASAAALGDGGGGGGGAAAAASEGKAAAIPRGGRK